MNDERITNDGTERRLLVAEGLEVREAEDAPPVIEGYAAVFNVPTTIWNFQEQIAPGAFKRTLANNPDVRATVEHEGGLTTIGRTRNGTLALSEDAVGLRVRIVPPDTQAGRDTLTLVRGGYVDQMSFAFRVPEGGEEWGNGDKGMPLRTLRDIELNDGDVSIVTYPAYPQTSAQARDKATAMSQGATAGAEHEHAERAKTQARAAARQREIQIKELER